MSVIREQQISPLYQFSDPALSELGLDEFLDAILARVVNVLQVDTASILLLDEDKQSLVARASCGIEAEVREHVTVSVGRGFAGRVAAERKPIAILELADADVVNPLLRAAGIHSMLGVPLIVEGKLIGVLHIGSRIRRSFTTEDLAALESVAARTAPGIERARLSDELRRELEVTVMLQRSLLPPQLAQCPGLSIAAGYAAAHAEAGGDWYDAFQLPGGQIGATVGDVVGNGIIAATRMGKLRTCLRAYALEGHSASNTLVLVNGFAMTMPDKPMATALYAIIDPSGGSVAIASAGHLPPIVVEPGGAAHLVPATPGPPLGAFPDQAAVETQLTLAPGATLVLYTDGLIERRGVPIDDSIEALRSLIATGSTANEICAMAFHQLVPPSGPSDDAAIMAIKRKTPES
jgi:GAF domain-containing protein